MKRNCVCGIEPEQGTLVIPGRCFPEVKGEHVARKSVTTGMCPPSLRGRIHQISFVLRTGSCVRGHITWSRLRNDLPQLFSERRLLCSDTISSAQPQWIESENAGSVNRLNATLLG